MLTDRALLTSHCKKFYLFLRVLNDIDIIVMFTMNAKCFLSFSLFCN